MSDYDGISQKENRKEASVDSLLEEAAAEAGRIFESVQAIAGTTICKGVQIAGLKRWAIIPSTAVSTFQME